MKKNVFLIVGVFKNSLQGQTKFLTRRNDIVLKKQNQTLPINLEVKELT